MPEQEAVGYWYIHSNGSIHFKPKLVVESGGGPNEYFAGPFCKRWWYGRLHDSNPVDAIHPTIAADILSIANRDFIARARSDIPYLLQALAASEARVDERHAHLAAENAALKRAVLAADTALELPDGHTYVVPKAVAERVKVLEDALDTAIKVAGEARVKWDDAPGGMRAGKLLIALEGKCPGYREDIDTIHRAARKAMDNV